MRFLQTQKTEWAPKHKLLNIAHIREFSIVEGDFIGHHKTKEPIFTIYAIFAGDYIVEPCYWCDSEDHANKMLLSLRNRINADEVSDLAPWAHESKLTLAELTGKDSTND